MGNMTLLLTLAAIAHEANRHYCLSIGDTSQPTWDDAPDWQKESAVKGIEGALAGNTPEQQHESWMQHKLADGWTYHEVKDATAKTHPCLVSYAELPEEQRRKDHLYGAVVRAAYGALTADLEPLPPRLDGTSQTGGQKPSIGRVVHYLSYGTPNGEYKPAHRAAIITDVRECDQFGWEVRVAVLNPDGYFNTPWTNFDQSATQGGTVHWPERE